MAPAAKDAADKGATKATKATPKAKAAPKAKKDASDVTASPSKGRKRAADALDDAPAAPKMDEPVKAAKKDVAKKTKAKAAAEKKEAATADAAATDAPETKPKAKKAKTTKAAVDAEAQPATKAEDKPAEAAPKPAKKKAEAGEPKPKKATKAKADDKDGETKPKKAAAKKDGAAEKKPTKAAAAKAAAAAAAEEPAVNGEKPKAAPKPRKRKASAVEETEGGAVVTVPKAKPASAAASKKQKTTKEPELPPSLLETVGASLQAATRRISGLFSGFGGSESETLPESNGVVAKKPKKQPAAKKASKANAAAIAATGENAEGARHGAALARRDSDGAHQDDESDDDVDDPDTAALLRGFASSDDEDAASGDEGFTPGKPIPKLPAGKALAKRLKGAAGTESDGPGVIYVGRIPHGFHEHEMRAYFSQFGDVQHVRLSRSRRTGRSKHYAFVQFASATVAAIAAETMDSYLMFGHILRCRVVPPEQVHPGLWRGADKRFKAVPWARIEGRKIALPKSRAEWDKKVTKETQRRQSKAAELKKLGYDFDMPAVKGVDSVPAKDAELPTEVSTEVVSAIVTTNENGEKEAVVEIEQVEVAPKKKARAKKAKA